MTMAEFLPDEDGIGHYSTFVHRVPSTELVDAHEFDDVTQRDSLVFEGVEESVQSEPAEAGTNCTDDSEG